MTMVLNSEFDKYKLDRSTREWQQVKVCLCSHFHGRFHQAFAVVPCQLEVKPQLCTGDLGLPDL